MAEQNPKIQQLRLQLERFIEQLDQLDPEETSVEDVDQLIELIEKIEQNLDRK
ncbi:SE1561 family protein [Gracilibacillus oryzae]|uniref:SE1561 family protein n=1 Tax=Gracilibacillus oryzae TaxID=1672701 RepID=UPI0018862F1B|nr:SE1561 family protein [Gracilibacillus oryzae]